MISLTPPSQQLSIHATSLASRNCLNTTQLWQCSPVATPILYFFRALLILVWPRMSSQLFGSSIHRGLYLIGQLCHVINGVVVHMHPTSEEQQITVSNINVNTIITAGIDC